MLSIPTSILTVMPIIQNFLWVGGTCLAKSINEHDEVHFDAFDTVVSFVFLTTATRHH